MSKSGGVFQIDDVTRTMSKGGGVRLVFHPSKFRPPPPTWLAGYGPGDGGGGAISASIVGWWAPVSCGGGAISASIVGWWGYKRQYCVVVGL